MNNPRDVTGGDKVMSGIVPGLGLVNYGFGWLNSSVEPFLRRDFGERYFTAPNFFAGLMVLLLIQLAGFLFGLFNPLNYVGMVFGGGGGASVASMMGTITKWYIYLGIFHFLRIWWNVIVGNPVHSFSSGRSWLRPIGQVVMFVLNLVLNLIVRLIFKINRKLDKRRLEFILPVLQDVDTFTERYIEPVFLLIVAIAAGSAGQAAVFVWLFLSAMALNVNTGMRHEQQRGFWLDIQDSMIESTYFQQAKNGPNKKAKKTYERMVKKAAYEVEVNPDMANIIERKNPNLADAMKAISPNLQKMGAANAGMAA